MKKYFRSVKPYLAIIVVLGLLGAYALTGPYDFNPPASHTDRLGVIPGSIDGWHKPGYTTPYVADPVDGTTCANCHGGALEGGTTGEPSCYYCHGAFWNTEHRSSWTYERQYPDSHTFVKSDIMPRTMGEVGWDCSYCHYSYYTGKPDENNYYHAPGLGTPYQSGCTNCHGTSLDNTDGIAVSCYWCHQNQWIGDGLPPDHENLDSFGNPAAYGSELKGGSVWHRFGWDDPYSIFDNQPGTANDSPDGCTRCHGSDLAGPNGPDENGDPGVGDGFAPSCFSCHGPGGGPPIDHDQPLGDPSGSPPGPVDHRPGYEDPFGAGGCTACHGSNLEGPPPEDDGYAKSCYTCHGKRWAPHDFSGEPWLLPGENHCYVCHLPPAFGGDSTPVWNHEPSTSTGFTVPNILATIGDPTGTSRKCMGCHEGEPTGPAVDEFGTTPTTTYYVDGNEAFGLNLAQHHPVSFTYNPALAVLHKGLHNPATAPSGLTRSGTIAEDMLESGELHCTACHDQHDDTALNYLVETPDRGLCFKCHLQVSVDPLQHHIPGRNDPWGDARGTTFNCTMCHGANLEGTAEAPACTECHNSFAFPDPPAPGHHGGTRTTPYFDCAVCHADPLTDIVTGNNFGTQWATSCYQCHDDSWNVGNQPPVNVSMADLSGTEGVAITFSASHITDPDQDPLAMQWDFGDGSDPGFPTHDPAVTHTYAEFGTYTATLAVTDGINPPQSVQFQVVVSPATTEPIDDTWTVTPDGDPSFDITFENHSGSLVGTQPDGTISFGIEFVGVIFWMDMWMDLSGNVFWGTGDTFFGNIDREAGTMAGVMFDDQGGVRTFGGLRP